MELLTVIAIIGILSAFALPNIISWLPKYRLGSAARQILSNVEYARLAAIKENISIGIGINIPSDYYVWRDNGQGVGGIADDATKQTGEESIRAGKMPAGVDITAAFGGDNRFRFNSAGFSIKINGFPGGGTISCSNAQGDTRDITITNGGNARID